MPNKSKVAMDRFTETKAKEPPMETTEEAKKRHLKMAREQGTVLGRAFAEMANNVAQRGEEKAAGHYLVGYAIEKPEGMYEVQDGELKWQEPQEENVHIEISVRDGADRRFVPALDVELTVLDAEGQTVGTHRQPFIWHPWLYHYGRNWKLPRDGAYTFRVKIAMPGFPRHDKENGKRYTETVQVEFRDVPVKTKLA